MGELLVALSGIGSFIEHSLYLLSVAQKFAAAWKHPKRPCPTVKNVYKIIEDDRLLQPYVDYK